MRFPSCLSSVRGDFLLIGKGAAILMGYPGMTQEVDRPIQSSANRHPASLTQTAIYSQTAKLAAIEAKRPAWHASMKTDTGGWATRTTKS